MQSKVVCLHTGSPGDHSDSKKAKHRGARSADSRCPAAVQVRPSCLPCHDGAILEAEQAARGRALDCEVLFTRTAAAAVREDSLDSTKQGMEQVCSGWALPLSPHTTRTQLPRQHEARQKPLNGQHSLPRPQPPALLQL